MGPGAWGDQWDQYGVMWDRYGMLWDLGYGVEWDW